MKIPISSFCSTAVLLSPVRLVTQVCVCGDRDDEMEERKRCEVEDVTKANDPRRAKAESAAMN